LDREVKRKDSIQEERIKKFDFKLTTAITLNIRIEDGSELAFNFLGCHGIPPLKA
jgi:hypothetical protein